jgi:hypothetical protein
VKTTYRPNAYHPFKGLAEVLTETTGGPWVETHAVHGALVTLVAIRRWKVGAVTMFPASPKTADELVY